MCRTRSYFYFITGLILLASCGGTVTTSSNSKNPASFDPSDSKQWKGAFESLGEGVSVVLIDKDESLPDPDWKLPLASAEGVDPVDLKAPIIPNPLASSVPEFAEWQRHGGPGDALSATGTGFSAAETEFIVASFPLSGAVSFSRAQLPHLDANSIIFKLGSVPENALHLVWPRNQSGFGRPIYINRAELFWMSHGTDIREGAYGDEVIHVFGQHLKFGTREDLSAENTPIVVIKNLSTNQPAFQARLAQGAHYQSDPYRLSVQLENLSIGTYEVRVHNRRGGQYGWSNALSFRVVAKPVQNAFTVNVAPPNGVDDFGSIQTATAAAYAWTSTHPNAIATLQFQPGTYYLADRMNLGSNIRYQGSLLGRTKIVSRLFAPGSPVNDPCIALPDGWNWHRWFIFGQNLMNITFSNLDIDAGDAANHTFTCPNGTSFGMASQSFFLRESYRIAFNDVNYRNLGMGNMDFHSSHLVTFDGGSLDGGSDIFLGAAFKVRFTGFNFKGANEGWALVTTWGTKGLAVWDSEIQQLDETQTQKTVHRVLDGDCHWGGNDGLYWAHTNVSHIGPIAGTWNTNSGENFLFEGCNNKGWGHLADIRKDTQGNSVWLKLDTNWKTDPNWGPNVGRVISIRSRRGLGQQQPISDYCHYENIGTTASPTWKWLPADCPVQRPNVSQPNYPTGFSESWVKVPKPWRVAPTLGSTGSTVSTSNANSNVVFYKNDIASQTGKITGPLFDIYRCEHTASSCFQSWNGGMFRLIIDSNRCEGFRGGVVLYSESNNLDYFNEVINNTLTDGLEGITTGVFYDTAWNTGAGDLDPNLKPDLISVGNGFRNNSIKRMKNSALHFWHDKKFTHPVLHANVYSNNQADEVAVGLAQEGTGSAVEADLIMDNTFNGGSVGKFCAEMKTTGVVFANNSCKGFQHPFGVVKYLHPGVAYYDNAQDDASIEFTKDGFHWDCSTVTAGRNGIDLWPLENRETYTGAGAAYVPQFQSMGAMMPFSRIRVPAESTKSLLLPISLISGGTVTAVPNLQVSGAARIQASITTALTPVLNIQNLSELPSGSHSLDVDLPGKISITKFIFTKE